MDSTDSFEGKVILMDYEESLSISNDIWPLMEFDGIVCKKT